MRVKLSLDLWRSLEPTNPTAILPDSEYVNVFINGDYQGLYLFAEKNDRRLFGLDDAQDNIDSSLIFQAKHEGNKSIYDPIYWEQDWPNVEDNNNIMDDILTNLYDFIVNSDDNLFFNPKNGIYSKFDKQNLIDFYIFNFFSFHQDFWGKNYFIIRNTAPSKFFLIPWDFDGTFGQWRDAIYDPSWIQDDYAGKKNELFYRLINNAEFMRECKIRWIELREKLWTEEKIMDMIFDYYQQIKDSLKLSMTLWDLEDEREKYLDLFFEYIPERLLVCDSYFSQF